MPSKKQSFSTGIPKQVYWIDHFSILTFCTIFKLSAGRESEIIFHSTTKVFLSIFSFLNIFFHKRFTARKINYSLGDMRSANGQSLRYEVEEMSAKMAIEMSALIVRTDEYQAIKSIFPSDKLIIYYQKRIKYEIYPIVRTARIIDYHQRNGNKDVHQIVWPGSYLFKSLDKTWNEGVPLMYTFKPLIDVDRLKLKAKEVFIFLNSFIYKTFYRSCFEKKVKAKSNKIAIHCYEGIDLSKRNDIFWIQNSNIKPESVLLYYDATSYALSPINAKVLNELERKGLTCVFLRKNPLQKLKPVWAKWISTCKVKRTLKRELCSSPSSPLEKWILVDASTYLIFNISYWTAFYRAFNIKLDVDIEETGYTNVIKAIALDIMGGFLVGYQRSELQETPGVCFGLYPQHIFFTWNQRTVKSLKMNNNMNDISVISGYCYDYIFKDYTERCNQAKKRLHESGVKLIVALYDNGFGVDSHFSKDMMDFFYRGFLKWMFSDEEVVLMIKPKKAWFLEKNLPDVKKLLDKAQATGRCIIHAHSQGRFPVGISMAADFAVGIGISTAILEAALSGTRGAFCDLTCNKSHYFYEEGYNKVAFHNIDYLISRIKEYKAGAENMENLGDFSPWLDNIDPFRDGMAYKRIGSYLNMLLMGFEQGLSTDVIIKNSNNIYEKSWGTDRIFTA